MALFGKKPMSVDEIKKAIAGLNEEEKNQLIESLTAPEETPEQPEQTDTPDDGAVGEDGTSQVDETPTETDAQPEQTDVQPEQSDEQPVVEEQPDVAEKHDEVMDAFVARLEKLETQYSELLSKLEAVASVKASDEFGAKGETPDESTEDELSEDARIMRNYYKK